MNHRQHAVRWAALHAREWLAGLALVGLSIGPAGCQIPDDLFTDPAADLPAGVGFFINQDEGTGVLAGARGVAGDVLFVFGEPDAGGAPDVSSILYFSPQGAASYILFEDGRPTYARGDDGSYVAVNYLTTSAVALTADVELYDAAMDQQSFFDVNVDLTETSAAIASLVTQSTGVPLDDVNTTDATSTAKLDNTSQVRITVLSPLFQIFVLPFIATIAVLTVIMGQILVAVFAVLAVTLQAVLLVALSPLFLITGLLDDVLVRIELDSLFDVFVDLPDPPIAITIS